MEWVIGVFVLAIGGYFFVNGAITSAFGGFRCPNCRRWFAGTVVSRETDKTKEGSWWRGWKTTETTTVHSKCRHCGEEWNRELRMTWGSSDHREGLPSIAELLDIVYLRFDIWPFAGAVLIGIIGMLVGGNGLSCVSGILAGFVATLILMVVVEKVRGREG